MPIIERTGNLFDTEAQAIGHGVNTKGVMGAGIAKQFKERYPRMYAAYRSVCYEYILNPGDVFPWRQPGQTIYTIASQQEPGRDAKYHWLTTGTAKTLMDMEERGMRTIALPQIGCGIGGLEWDGVRNIMGMLARDFPSITLELWTYAP